MTPIAVVTTVATQDDARRLARALVEQRLAACAQISAIESVYRWQGAVQQEVEQRVLFKTVHERYAEVEAAIRAIHPYELPAIHALPLAEVFPAYAEWVVANSRPMPDAGAPAEALS
jgi:periplasmic divalent cation tolerance protein